MGSMALPHLNTLPMNPPPDMIQQYGNLMQLRNMMQEEPIRQQIMQQQAESGDIAVQQQRIALNDQKAMTTAMQQWDGKDLNSLVPLVVKNGASANAVMGLKSKMLEQQQAYSKIAADDATTGEKNLGTLKGKADMVSGALGSVIGMPDDQIAQGLTQTTQDLLQKGLLDQPHAQAAAQLAQSGNPTQIRQQLSLMQKGMMAQSAQIDMAAKQATSVKDTAQAQEATTNAAKNQAEVDYYKNPGGSPVGAPGVPIQTVQMRDWLQKHPGKGPSDYEVAMAGGKAGAEASARLPYEMALERQKQVLEQGDPVTAAKLLVNGDATLSELKARGATPNFIARTLYSANQISGGKFNAQASDASFDVAKSPENTAFFGSAKSLTDKGGTLDQLANVAKTIPGHQLPTLNSLDDWTKLATGNGPLAHYASTALGVADDYAKVMGGGVGSDASRLQALNLIKADQSPDAKTGAIAGIRDAVNSQKASRIGSNPVMKRMYGDAPDTGLVTMRAPNGQTKQVKPEEVAHFKSMGAQVVSQ